MFGAIAGDVIGSVYEFTGIKTIEFPLFSRETTFTDDSVMTAAVAAALLEGWRLCQRVPGVRAETSRPRLRIVLPHLAE